MKLKSEWETICFTTRNDAFVSVKNCIFLESLCYIFPCEEKSTTLSCISKGTSYFSDTFRHVFCIIMRTCHLKGSTCTSFPWVIGVFSKCFHWIRWIQWQKKIKIKKEDCRVGTQDLLCKRQRLPLSHRATSNRAFRENSIDDTFNSNNRDY